MEAGFVVHSLVGFFLLHAIAWALSEDRRTVAWRPVIAGMLLTFGLGLVLLKAPYAKDAFLALNGALNALEKATRDGTAFVGMVEAPLVVRLYVRNMSRGELFILMSCGMATVAGTVMALYASILSKVIPDAFGHILIASIISTPAAIAISVLMVPGKASTTEGKLAYQAATSSMDAVTRGTVDGAQLLVNIVAMLLVLVSLVSLANQVLALLPGVAGAPVTLQRVLGVALAPLVWIMGIP